jgi:hypothetical protein
MTPKEKAIELVEKFTDIENEYNEYSDFKQAKQCALIAVDEILSVINYNSEMHFWIKVKKEIEKL